MRLAVICGRAPIPDETFIRRELEDLRRKHDVRVFGLARRWPALRGLSALRQVPFRRALSLFLRWRTVLDVAGHVADGGEIIAHFAWTTADIAAAASRVSGHPWECHVHAWDVFTRPPAELRSRLESASRIVACSRLAADAVAASGISRERIAIVPHPLPMSKILPLREKRRSNNEPGTNTLVSNTLVSDTIRIVAVGRLVPKKGFDTLVRAYPYLLSPISYLSSPICGSNGVRLEFVGDGPERRKLERLANRLGIPAGAVVFRGALPEEETLEAIAESDIFVLPSRVMPDGDRDGISNALAEAVALGVPAITTDAGAAAELVSDTNRESELVSDTSSKQVPGSTAKLVVLHAPVAPKMLADAILREMMRLSPLSGDR